MERLWSRTTARPAESAHVFSWIRAIATAACARARALLQTRGATQPTPARTERRRSMPNRTPARPPKMRRRSRILAADPGAMRPTRVRESRTARTRRTKTLGRRQSARRPHLTTPGAASLDRVRARRLLRQQRCFWRFSRFEIGDVAVARLVLRAPNSYRVERRNSSSTTRPRSEAERPRGEARRSRGGRCRAPTWEARPTRAAKPRLRSNPVGTSGAWD